MFVNTVFRVCPNIGTDKKIPGSFLPGISEFIMSQRLSGLGELKCLKEIIDLLLVTLAAVDGINLGNVKGESQATTAVATRRYEIVTI